MGTIAVIVWIAFGTASAITAINRGEGGCGWFIAGVVLGPIGLILAFYTGKKCPDCASRISKEAKVCPKCRARLPKVPEKKEKPELSGEDVVIGFKATLAGLASVPGSVGIILGLTFSYLYLTNNFPDGDAGNIFSIVGGLFMIGVVCAVIIFQAWRAKEVDFGWSLQLIGISPVLLLIASFVPGSWLEQDFKFYMGGISILAFMVGFTLATMRAASAVPKTSETADAAAAQEGELTLLDLKKK